MIKSICFLATYQCNASCDYCECRPRNKTRIPLDEIHRLIDEAKALGTVNQVVFSGGEPTLLGNDLFECIAHATRLGMMTRVVTNGHWGRTPEKAFAFVDRLLAAGLSEINISVDDLHQRWIPIESIRNSFLACYTRQLSCLIAHKQTQSSTITRAYLEELIGMEFVDFDSRTTYTKEEQCRLITTGVVIPVGPYDPERDLADDLLYSKWWGPCSSVLKDIIVGARGNFLPCCGIVSKDIPELTRDQLADTPLIDAIDNANRDLMLNWIALEGPGAIVEAVRGWAPELDLPREFAGICHACNEVLSRTDVREVIASHLDDVEDRVSLHRAFLEQARPDSELMRLYDR